ncbi:MAG: hypothetical protein JWO78_1015 [Micavibrio sp.]|nr:hypothetical protein [Micavibrio sp.]
MTSRNVLTRLPVAPAADNSASLYGYEKPHAPTPAPEPASSEVIASHAPVSAHLPLDGGFTIWVDHNGQVVCGDLPISPVVTLEPFVPGPAPVPVAPDSVPTSENEPGGYTPGDILLDLEGFMVYVGHDGNTIAVGTPPASGYHLPPMPAPPEASDTHAVGVHLPVDGGFTISADAEGNVFCGDAPAGPVALPVLTNVTDLQHSINSFLAHTGDGVVSSMPTQIAPVSFSDIYTAEIVPAHNDLIV